MKQLKVALIGSTDDGLSEVSGGQQYPNWDFSGNPTLICVIMDRRTLPAKIGGGTYDLYTVIEVESKKPYAFFCGKVLEDRLKNIPVFAKVKITFLGVHPSKRYHQFSVQNNLNFRYDPKEFTLDNFVDVKPEENPRIGGANNQKTATQGNTNNGATPGGGEFDDLPF